MLWRTRGPRSPALWSIAAASSPTPRIATENQVALIQQIGSNFESSQYPGLLDLLASSPATPSPDPEPVKQTVSVKTVSVAGASGVLETEADVDNYLTALRSALIETLNDGKRITL